MLQESKIRVELKQVEEYILGDRVLCKTTVGKKLWKINCGTPYPFLRTPKKTSIPIIILAIVIIIVPTISLIVKSIINFPVSFVVDSISSEFDTENTYTKKDGIPTNIITKATMPNASLPFKIFTRVYYSYYPIIKNFCLNGCCWFKEKLSKFLPMNVFSNNILTYYSKCVFYVCKSLNGVQSITMCHPYHLSSYTSPKDVRLFLMGVVFNDRLYQKEVLSLSSGGLVF